MSAFPKVILRNNKADAVKRFHPWIFSGAIKAVDQAVREGSVVEVVNESGDFLAVGHYSPSNIAVKILSFQPVEELGTLFEERVKQAFAVRQNAGLVGSDRTNCYRLINAEGDGLPGLIVDWYNGTAVVQAYSLGMQEARSHLLHALQSIYGSALKAVYDKSAAVLPRAEMPVENQYWLGDRTHEKVLENGHQFFVDWETGQKTGFFLDQRDNRALLGNYATGKRVLNTFCYSGGFSVYAVRANAKEVHSVDSSAKAIEWTKTNIELNNSANISHTAFTADVFTFLKECDASYDVIILDPPAFAKNITARHQAVMAYKRLNSLALHKLSPGGLLFTFSCSQVVTPDLFKGGVTAGAIESGKVIRILHSLTQPADHPVSIYHPEGLYLKGLVLQVD
ncbi:MAG TPA: class I SAM-dependent rRNA methyltransferase [Synechococcales cyanobacterium M55_K2018_004]|nr:class I SAM-dependent rRNA methyltransferase [Synechococcales cyanobacterium M55_K2018_004]